MTMEIIRIQDRIKVDVETLKGWIQNHVEQETGRQVSSVELHIDRTVSALGSERIAHVTVYLKHRD